MSRVEAIRRRARAALAFDCCKIVSAQVLLDEDIDDFEHVQDKTPTAFIPLGRVVTLSGTGAEQNNGGVITNEPPR